MRARNPQIRITPPAGQIPCQISPVQANLWECSAIDPGGQTLSRKVLFSAVKNEGPTLLEWVAYHRLIGFDTIYIASNDCTDGTDSLLDAMAREGLIQAHLPHRPDKRYGPQKSAIGALNKSGLLQDGDWFAFLDADEYLNIHLGAGTVDDLITKIGARKGMVIPWRLFGDGGTSGVIERQIHEDFSRANGEPAGEQLQVKSFFRYQRGLLEFSYGNMHRPQVAKDSALTLDDFLLAGDAAWDTESETNRKWIEGRRSAGSARISAAEHATGFAQVNHYSVRNPDMFALKQTRGRGFYRKQEADAAPRVRHNEDFYRTHNTNEAEDTSILRHKLALDQLIADYLQLSTIRSCHEHTVDQTRRDIAGEPQALAGEAFSPKKVRLDADADAFLPKITLPEPEARLLTGRYRDAGVILEYGSGGSTVFAASLPHRPTVFSVETDQQWSQTLGASIKDAYPKSGIKMRYCDIGPTKAWGRPRNHRNYLRYPDYSLGIYDDPEFTEPDLIFIDGRFRQACFYAAMLRMTKPVTVLWDDYTDRSRYHGVERYFKPVETVGRMARFEIEPSAFPAEDTAQIIKAIMDSE